LTRGLWR